MRTQTEKCGKAWETRLDNPIDNDWTMNKLLYIASSWVSIINGLEYGNEQWNGKWNETVKVHSCSYQGNLRIMSVRCGTCRKEREKKRAEAEGMT